MTLRQLYISLLPAPGLPDDLNELSPATEQVDAMMKDSRYRKFDRYVAGVWFASISEIAIAYWGEPVERKTPPKWQTELVDDIVMKAVKASSHKWLEHRQICQGVLMLRKWKTWLSERGNEGKDGESDGRLDPSQLLPDPEIESDIVDDDGNLPTPVVLARRKGFHRLFQRFRLSGFAGGGLIARFLQPSKKEDRRREQDGGDDHRYKRKSLQTPGHLYSTCTAFASF
jgi:hypothetical protein